MKPRYILQQALKDKESQLEYAASQREYYKKHAIEVALEIEDLRDSIEILEKKDETNACNPRAEAKNEQ